MTCLMPGLLLLALTSCVTLDRHGLGSLPSRDASSEDASLTQDAATTPSMDGESMESSSAPDAQEADAGDVLVSSDAGDQVPVPRPEGPEGGVGDAQRPPWRDAQARSGSESDDEPDEHDDLDVDVDNDS